MKLSCSVSGLNELQRKLAKGINKSEINRIVAQNTSELQQKAISKAPISTEITNPGGDHGHLKRSIQIEVNGETGIVRATANYAMYVEKGTRFMASQPYMEPAFNEQKPIFLRDLKKAISKL